MTDATQDIVVDLSNCDHLESKVLTLIEHHGIEDIAEACTPLIYQKFTQDDGEQRFSELEWFFRVEADIAYNQHPDMGGKEFAMEIYGQDISTFMGVSDQEYPVGIDLTAPRAAIAEIFNFLSSVNLEMACIWRWNLDLCLAVFHTIDCASLSHPDSQSKEEFLNENFPEWKNFKNQIEESAHTFVRKYPRVMAELAKKLSIEK